MMFITRTGRHVPESATDQAGSDMLVRTVSRYTDGTAIDRPHVCVSPELTAGSAELAQRMAADLDRRGYLPPERPMSREEFEALKRAKGMNYAGIIWDVLGRGIPAGTAVERAKLKGRHAADGVRREIRRLGWVQTAEEK